jgi:hypothetical protein
MSEAARKVSRLDRISHITWESCTEAAAAFCTAYAMPLQLWQREQLFKGTVGRDFCPFVE